MQTVLQIQWRRRITLITSSIYRKHSEHNREDFFKTLNISFQACIDKYMPDFGQTQKSLKEKIKNVACFIKGGAGRCGWKLADLKQHVSGPFCGPYTRKHPQPVRVRCPGALWRVLAGLGRYLHLHAGSVTLFQGV